MKKYQDPTLPVNQRVADLLSRMTIDEKVAQLGAQWLKLQADGDHQTRELEMTDSAQSGSLRDKLAHGLGQITRPLGTVPVDAKEGVMALNALQKQLVEETRLGIPAIPHEECLVGLMAKGATLCPSSLNYGHTWNPQLIEQLAEEIGKQARSVGCKQGLAPVLDVSRDVRWGRTEECLSEDPYHTGIMATSYVKGLQGENRDLYATLKHFVGHSYSEGARNHAPVHLGFKELNDTFLLPFEMAVKLGNAASVMPAYHDIDNEACHASHHLLTEVLRNQWGFDGLIVADYGGIELLKSHHALTDTVEGAAALALKAGVDVELPDDCTSSRFKQALEKELISEADLDQTVSRVLKAKFELGLFEDPYTDVESVCLASDKADALAYQVASESIVLLENRNTLPLAAQTKLAVVGPTADDAMALLGGYSFPVHLILSKEESDGVKVCPTILDALSQQFEHVSYAKGCDILTERHANAPVFPGDVNMVIDHEAKWPLSEDVTGFAEMESTIDAAEVAIVCVGDLAGLFQTGTVGEGSDVDSLELPGVQLNMLQRAVETGKPVVVVMTGGRPYNLGGLEDKVAAIVCGWAPGQEGARAIADVLSGVVNPSGRLTVSIPKSAGAVPYFYNHKLKSAGTPVAFHFGSKYGFGYGLSYTQFEYGEMTLAQASVDMEGVIDVTVEVSNRGDVSGSEVVQLYVRDCVCSLVRPLKELKGFNKVALAAGETKQVCFSLPVDMLNFTDYSGQRVVEAGEFEIMVGSSADSIHQRAMVMVEGTKRVLPKQWRMVCETR
ncbi:BglX [Vibrio sp. qd031]|uniref:glycoside hydrolase family 3 N-terminal domain-containing protein n=1 Tax=Vibrio sp. qd031 TaxID=1603038 RepID=UPI000A22D6A4|nr:glycoside hydrolase family 3 N-terminal domain-containing protein [Vibrio sp. qd031]ORT51139.1 BglX [Vibrio sp. qd031]